MDMSHSPVFSDLPDFPILLPISDVRAVSKAPPVGLQRPAIRLIDPHRSLARLNYPLPSTLDPPAQKEMCLGASLDLLRIVPAEFGVEGYVFC